MSRVTRGERGQVTVMIIGFATILVMAVVVVVDASAAFLQRQALGNLADGAALHGADLGSTGVYENGLPDDRLVQQEASVRAAVADYLDRTRAARRYPGITATVSVDRAAGRVAVRLTAPIELPLHLPGTPASAEVSATSSAAVMVRR